MARKRCAFTFMELIVVIGILFLVTAMVIPAIMKVRNSADGLTCANNLRFIGLALHQFHREHGYLPGGCYSDLPGSPYPFMTWAARLLPYIEQDALWENTQQVFKSSPNFLFPQHEELRKTIITKYLCPLEWRSVCSEFPRMALLSYLGVAGTNQSSIDGVLFLDSKISFGSIHDGLSNTVIIGERPPAGPRSEFGWWYAGWGQNKNGSADSILGVRELNTCQSTYGKYCEPGPYHFQNGDPNNIADAFHFWSHHPKGGNFLFADGSYRFLTYSADMVLPALSTRAGKEVFSIPE